MAQALLFINGELINRKVSADGGLVDRLVKSGMGDSEILDELYWSALGRPPSQTERTGDLKSLHQALAAQVTAASASASSQPSQASAAKVGQDLARRHVLEDMLWVLVNSKEFLFNH